MIGYIVKRDGRKVAFNRNKIANAIKKSMISAHSEEQGYVVDQDLIDSLTDEVVLQIEDRDDVVPCIVSSALMFVPTMLILLRSIVTLPLSPVLIWT